MVHMVLLVVLQSVEIRLDHMKSQDKGLQDSLPGEVYSHSCVLSSGEIVMLGQGKDGFKLNFFSKDVTPSENTLKPPCDHVDIFPLHLVIENTEYLMISC